MHKVASIENALYTAAEVRELDRLAIQQHGVSGLQLMKRAGRAVFDVVMECWPEPGLMTVYCGAGNNGGDGYIIAALAAQRHLPVQVVQVVDTARLKGDARRAYEYAVEHGVAMHGFKGFSAPQEGVVIDALLGTGLNGDVQGLFAEAIAQINGCQLPVAAVDVPSGLNSDTGMIGGCGVQADLTVTFIGCKRGLFTGMGPEFSGEIFFDALELPFDLYKAIVPSAQRLELADALAVLPRRQRHAHKGDFGHVLLVGGDHGYGGAVLMAAEATARCGAGLTTVATRVEHVNALLSRRPEVMAQGVETHHQLLPLLERASVLVLGPGLGQSAWSEQMAYHSLRVAQQRDIPVVLDADALNLLSKPFRLPLPSQLLISPHPGEAARLLGCETLDVQADRFSAVQRLRDQFSATVVLKGAGTLIAGDRLSLCAYGNPGMASGGMGDVLSGILGALLAQGVPLEQAAQLGVCVHGRAADFLAEQCGERGLLASDLIGQVRQLLNFHE